MGHEIVYCFTCRCQLRSADFERGAALRLQSRAYCLPCAEAVAPRKVQVLSEAAGRLDALPPRHGTFPRSTQRRSAAPRRPNMLLIGAGVAGGFLVLILIGVVASGRSGPSARAPVEPREASVPAPPPAVPPRAAPVEKRPEPPAASRKTLAAEFEELDTAIRGYRQKGEYPSALMVLEAARKRHAEAEWVGGIDRRFQDLAQEAENARAKPQNVTPVAKQETAPATGPDPHLAIWLALDEGSGTAAKDGSMYGNHGTLVKGPSWIAGQMGNALAFDGVNSRVEVPDSPSLRLTGPFTLAAWVKAATESGIQRGIVEKWEWNGSSASRGYCLRMSSDGKARCAVADAAGEVNVSGRTTLPTDRWTHLVGMFDGSSVRVYVNGRLDGRLETARVPTGSPGSLTIGAAPGGGNRFAGGVDDVRIYNRALSDEEIAALVASR